MSTEAAEPAAKKAKTEETGWENHTMNVSEALMKADEAKHFSDIKDSHVSTLQGIGEVASEVAEHLHVKTVSDLAGYKYFHMARSIKTLAETETEGGRLEGSVMNIDQAVDKEWEAKSLKEIVGKSYSCCCCCCCFVRRVSLSSCRPSFFVFVFTSRTHSWSSRPVCFVLCFYNRGAGRSAAGDQRGRGEAFGIARGEDGRRPGRFQVLPLGGSDREHSRIRKYQDGQGAPRRSGAQETRVEELSSTFLLPVHSLLWSAAARSSKLIMRSNSLQIL